MITPKLAVVLTMLLLVILSYVAIYYKMYKTVPKNSKILPIATGIALIALLFANLYLVYKYKNGSISISVEKIICIQLCILLFPVLIAFAQILFMGKDAVRANIDCVDKCLNKCSF